jgi:hypothetical protein
MIDPARHPHAAKTDRTAADNGEKPEVRYTVKQTAK